MSVLGALFSGVSGLGAESQALSVISDNIANSNTTAFKASVANFSTLVTATNISTGGFQPGGVVAHSATQIAQQGLLQSTSSNTDLAISGGGFFVVNNTANDTGAFTFTRAGGFIVDANGDLKNGDGFFLQGQKLTPNEAAAIAAGNTNQLTATALNNLQTINVNGLSGSAKATQNITLAANLPASDTAASTNPALGGNPRTMTVPVFDSQGTEHDLTLSFSRVPSIPAIQTFTLGGTGLTAGHPVQFTLNGQTFNTAPLAGNTTAAVVSAINTTLQANNITTITAAAPTGTTITFTDSTGTALNASDSIAEIIPTFAGPAATQAGSAGPPVVPTIDTFTLSAGALTAGDVFNFSVNGVALSTGAIAGSPPTMATLAGAMQAAVNAAKGANPSLANITIGSGANTITVTDTGGAALNPAPTLADANVPTFSAPANTQAGTTNANIWTASASIAGGILAPLGSNNTVIFNPDGTINAGTTLTQLTVQSWTGGGAAPGQVLNLNLGTANQPNGLTQFGSAFAVSEVNQDGLHFGNFTGVTIDQNGIVTANFDNGLKQAIYLIPIATFPNPNALAAQSGNVYLQTNDSGSFLLRQAGEGAAGQIAPSSLENSTVDIAQEFSNLIITQRAYEANTKIITTADEMLQSLLQAKQ